MWDTICDVTIDAGLDTLKLIPFLFVTYLLMEWFEHRMETKTQSAVLKAGRLGPLVGGIVYWDKNTNSVHPLHGRYQMMVGTSSRSEDLQTLEVIF